MSLEFGHKLNVQHWLVMVKVRRKTRSWKAKLKEMRSVGSYDPSEKKNNKNSPVESGNSKTSVSAKELHKSL